MNENEPILVSGNSGKAEIPTIQTAATVGVVLLKTWKCEPCKAVVLQGEPCPTCNKQLLLG